MDFIHPDPFIIVWEINENGKETPNLTVVKKVRKDSWIRPFTWILTKC